MRRALVPWETPRRGLPSAVLDQYERALEPRGWQRRQRYPVERLGRAPRFAATPSGSRSAGRPTFANGGQGILVSSASLSTIGSATVTSDGNVIRGNLANGIVVTGAPANRNAIRRNSIVSNGLRGIDLGNNGVSANDVGDVDFGANDTQNFPVLTSVAGGVQGTLNSRPNVTYQVDIFTNAACDSSGNGEGESLVGSVSVATDANGNATLPFFPIGPGVLVTATATSASWRHLGVLGVRHIRSVERSAGRQRGRRPERQCRQRRATQRHRLERSGF